ncbi:MAG: hypothetical protein IPO22_22345 [Anaerolineales bacterium]|nr:hypothetical protein [Anaerolineales bacterium]
MRRSVVDVKVQYLAQMLHELIWQKEKICKTVGLFAKSGEVYGRHKGSGQLVVGGGQR